MLRSAVGKQSPFDAGLVKSCPSAARQGTPVHESSSNISKVAPEFVIRMEEISKAGFFQSQDATGELGDMDVGNVTHACDLSTRTRQVLYNLAQNPQLP